jgi:hypothetical protein
VIPPLKILAQWLARTIGQQETCIVPKHCIADRRLHTDTGGTPRNEQIFGAQLVEHRVQLSAVKAAKTMFIEDVVSSLGGEGWQNLGVPGIPD